MKTTYKSKMGLMPLGIIAIALAVVWQGRF